MRSSVSISVTVPAQMAKEAMRLAKRQKCSMSALMRDALASYQATWRRPDEEERWVERIIEDARRNPMSPEDLEAEDQRLLEATRKYASPDLTDDDIVLLCRATRISRRTSSRSRH